MRYLLTFLLIAAVQGGIAQNKPMSSYLSGCYRRASGGCQSLPLTKAEEHEDEIYRQVNGLIVELGDRILPTKDVIMLVWLARWNGSRDEETLKTLQEIKTRTEPAKPSKPMGCVIEPCHIYDVGPAPPSNVSSDITSLSFSENHGTTPKPLLTVAAPQPLVEKAVADTNKGHCKPCLETNCTMDCKWEFSYTCPKHPGFHVFLLPDESTGEKMCVMLPRSK